MAIETYLNQFVSTDLNHDRGTTDGVLARYLGAAPAVNHIMNDFENYVGVWTFNSEQHVDLNISVWKRYDIDILNKWVENHKPFAFELVMPLVQCHFNDESPNDNIDSALSDVENSLVKSLEERLQPAIRIR